LLLGLMLGWWLRKRIEPAPPLPPGPPRRPPRIPDNFGEQDLSSTLGLRLAGAPADGRALSSSSSQKVIWVESGNEVLVHLDSLRTQILDSALLVSVDLETDQTGRTPLVVALALGKTDDPAGLIAVTDDLPRGNGLLASRWGKTLQDAIWAGLLGLATDHASERGLTPQAIATSLGTLHLRAGAAPSVVAAAPAGVAR